MAVTPESAKAVLEAFLADTTIGVPDNPENRYHGGFNRYALFHVFMDDPERGREVRQALETAIACLGDWQPYDWAERAEYEDMQRLNAGEFDKQQEG